MGLVVALAGCLASPPATPEVGPPVGAAQADPLFAWMDCRGLTGVFDVEADRVRDVLPAAFEPRADGEMLVPVLLEGFHCGKNANGTAILADGAHVLFRVPVTPATEAWAGTTPSFYVFDTLVSATIYEATLSALGIPVRTAEAKETRTVALDSEVRAERFQTEGGAVEYQYMWRMGQSGADEMRVYYWFPAADGFRRVAVERTFVYDGMLIQSGTLSVDGDLEIAKLLPGGCCARWNGQSYQEIDQVWTGTPEVFVP